MKDPKILGMWQFDIINDVGCSDEEVAIRFQTANTAGLVIRERITTELTKAYLKIGALFANGTSSTEIEKRVYFSMAEVIQALATSWGLELGDVEIPKKKT